LTEKYRPRTLAGLWGQPKVVAHLKRFAGNPHPAAFLFEGETGTGKTSAALALARALGCDVAQGEWGGAWEIASGEQSADAVREVARHLHLRPAAGSGWRLLIVNEADRMCRPAEVIWLDVLEHLPHRAVVVFTTNEAGSLSARLRDRCTRVAFESSYKRMAIPARGFVTAVWRAETKRRPPKSLVEGIVKDAVQEGRVSLRRAVQLAGAALMERDEG
jgi:DNA polymerase III delta prime subunit